MQRIDNMLMIGSTGPNAGKTSLACRLIKRFCAEKDIIAIKVTTIKAKDGQCPRGGQGCGVCSSLEGDYLITEETNPDSKKDTSKLLKAGAEKVFWLRVLKDHLNEGLNTLLNKIESDSALICESNSLRNAAEPGVFLMVTNNRQKAWKKTAAAVKNYIDRTVTADFDIDDVKLLENKWLIKRKAAAIILAGGQSKRLGQNKAHLLINGDTLLEHIYKQLQPCFAQVIISTDKDSSHNFSTARLVSDEISGLGPLQGIASALKASEYEINFVTACDIPQIDMSLVNKMMRYADDYDAVLPMSVPGKPEPLFAIYKKIILPDIERSLSSGKRRIIEPLDKCKVKYLDLEGDHQLVNINTMDDYIEFLNRKKDGNIPPRV